MNINLKKIPLTKDYLYFSIIVMLFVLGVSVYTSLNSWHAENKKRLWKYNIQANKLSDSLEESFDYVSNFMNYMGQQLIRAKDTKPLTLANILQNKNKDQYDFFTWTVYDFVTPEGDVIASSMHGVIKEPKKVYPTQRSWMIKAPKQPWQPHVSKPDIGITSGKPMIPMGLGVVDQGGKFLGTFSMGFDISKLARKLERSIGIEGISFVLVDEDFDMVLQSSDQDKKIYSEFFQPLSYINNVNAGSGVLDEPVNFNGITYSYYKKIDKYPYTILLGENDYLASLHFKQAVLPNLVMSLLLGIFFLSVLYFFRKRLIQPVQELAQAALAISKGDKKIVLPRGGTHEFFILKKHLLKLKFSLSREKKIKDEQASLLQIIKEADKEKERFFMDMSCALREPLHAIINGAEIARKEMLGPLCIENYGACFDAMYDAGRQLESYTTEYLRPDKVNIKEIMDKCVIITKRFAAESTVKFSACINSNIPEIWADELRLKQIILSTLFHSIAYTLPKGTVELAVKYSRNNNSLVIKITDTGLGFDEEERKNFQKRLQQNPALFTQDKLPMPIIRHLVALHHGDFTMKAKIHEGTIFTIILPYLDKKDLETHPDDFKKKARRKNKKNNSQPSLPDNVIKFPSGNLSS